MRHLLDIGVKGTLRAVERGVTLAAQVAGVLFLLLSFLITWTVFNPGDAFTGTLEKSG